MAYLDFYYEDQTLPQGAQLTSATLYPQAVVEIAAENGRTPEEVLAWDGCELNGVKCHAYIIPDRVVYGNIDNA